MLKGICNKCGERQELALAGSVCHSCSDALDRQWGNAAATDWVLLAPSKDMVADPSAPRATVADIMVALKKSISATTARSDNLMSQGLSVLSRLGQFSWLTMPSGDGEIFDSAEEHRRYVYRNTTYSEMKSNWALGSPSDDLNIGSTTPEEMAELRAISGARLQLRSVTFIRPATAEELAKHDAVLRDIQRHQESSKIFEKWGFDLREGVPLDGVWDRDAEERAKKALEETRRRLEQLGLLERSNYEYVAALAQNESGRTQQLPGPGRGLSQVVGMSHLKEQLLHEVLGPFRDPELYRRYRVSLPNGILFYGPPGCGKTYIAQRLAEELGWFFQRCLPSDVASPYIHDTVRKIREVFSIAIEKAPSILFIDEFEAFVPARSGLGSHQQYKGEEVNEFLANLEGCAERKVLVIAATNEPEKIDPAVRRSGRFDKLILIPPPDLEARLAMLDFHLEGRPVTASIDTAAIGSMLEGYSSSDIKLLVDEAARMALKQIEWISRSTLLAALERVPASITADDMKRYSAFRSRGI